MSNLKLDLNSRLGSSYFPKITSSNAAANVSDDDDGESQDEQLFVIDKAPDYDSKYGKTIADKVRKTEEPRSEKPTNHGVKLNPGLNIKTYVGKKPATALKLLNDVANADEIYKQHCIIKPGLSEQTMDPSLYRTSKRQRKKTNKVEREKTAGKEWFDMKTGELSERDAIDFKILQMRDALDPRRFYKRGELKKLPKYFQVGTIVGTSADYYSNATAKQSKKTLVDELIEDAQQKSWVKRKYNEIMSKRRTNIMAKKRVVRRNAKQEKQEKRLNKKNNKKSKSQQDD